MPPISELTLEIGTKMKNCLLVLSCCFLMVPASVTFASEYNLVPLGTLGNGTSSANAINNKGQVVGVANGHAVLFDSSGAGNNIDLGTLGGDSKIYGGISSYAASINDNGQVVGWAELPSGIDFRATLFDSTGSKQNTNLGTNNTDDSFAYSINNKGQIVGNCYDMTGGSTAMLFDTRGQFYNQNLGTLFSDGRFGNRGVAHCINEQSQIVGTSYLYSIDSDVATNFVTPMSGKYDTPLADNESSALSINDLGEIVGYYTGVAAIIDGTGHNNTIKLGSLPNYQSSSATSVNNLGQIVGGAFIRNTTDSRAVIFDQTGLGNNIDLNALINSNLGWKLESANAINDNGWIVGNGIDATGAERAYLLIPVPEPCTLILMLLGVVCYLRLSLRQVCVRAF